MSQTLTTATVLITLALVFYTVGVWAERLKRYLQPWHVAAFWLGLVFDTAGTYAMERITGVWDWASWHALTGLVAILLMLAHATWATAVLVRKDEAARATFHRFSLVVWLAWLVPYVGGLIVGMFGSRL
jgi:uncharacterized repeat protein (TIGR03987 family)